MNTFKPGDRVKMSHNALTGIVVEICKDGKIDWKVDDQFWPDKPENQRYILSSPELLVKRNEI